MSMDFSGLVSICNKDYPYTFSNYEIVIEGDFSLYVDPGKKLWDQLCGTITNEPCIITFFLESISRVSIRDKGYSAKSIHIPVRFYVILEYEYKGEVMLKFKNAWVAFVSDQKYALIF